MGEAPGPSDAELLMRARLGEGRAFEELFDRHMRKFELRIRRRIPAALRSKVSATDVAQEARIVALRRIHDFEDRGDGSFGAWLRKIVDLKLREATRVYRGAAKRDIEREVPRGARPDTANFKASTATPSQHAMAAEAHLAADRAFRLLPSQYQEVLHLFRHEGLPLKDVAVRMERSLDATKKLSTRAITRFAALYAEESGGRPDA